MTTVTVRYDADGVKIGNTRYETIADAADAVAMEPEDLLDLLEAGDGEATINAN